MDPNATLANIRALLTRSTTHALSEDETQELIESIEALDTWITRGGFLPAEWVTVPATSYDIATRMPLPAHDATHERYAVSPLDASVFDPHAAFVANELGDDEDDATETAARMGMTLTPTGASKLND